MLLELHFIQNFAPANLNRDDTGAPKDAEFGGYRRARISSQCLKRAIRTALRDGGAIGLQDLGLRTKRIRQELIDALVAAGREPEAAASVVDALLGTVNLRPNDEGKTPYLLFLGRREIEALGHLCDTHWKTLAGMTGDTKGAKKGTRDGEAKSIANAVGKVLDGGKARDVALFGRMLADLPERRVDAACQVAHALSTNRVTMEFDYYTAVDDLKPEDTQGADMIGTVEFNSACFYRYANLDLEQLAANLQGDRQAAIETGIAFVRAAIGAIPTGKQNSMAAHNPPSLVFVVLRSQGTWSLANAFVNPVRPTAEADLVAASIAALDTYWGQLTGMYGSDGMLGAWVCATDRTHLARLTPAATPKVEHPASVAALVEAVHAAVHA